MVRVSMNLRIVATAVLCAAFAGCSSSDKSGGTGSTATVLSSGLIRYAPMYSAYDDGSHDYQLPAFFVGCATDAAPTPPDGTLHGCGAGTPINADGSDPLKPETAQWTVDSSAASKDAYSDTTLPGSVLLTTKKAGTSKVTVTVSTKSGKKFTQTTTLQVTAATADEWTAGDARYNNNVTINLGMLMPGMGGVPMIPKDASCANCHNNMAGSITVEHTPQQTAGYSDDDLIAIFTTGVKPMGATFNSPFLNNAFLKSMPALQEMIYKSFHTWTIDPDVEKGVVFKLRSIPPMAQPSIDTTRIFMMFMMGGANAGGGAAGAAPANTAGSGT
jgi:hypothetical protein